MIFIKSTIQIFCFCFKNSLLMQIYSIFLLKRLFIFPYFVLYLSFLQQYFLNLRFFLKKKLLFGQRFGIQFVDFFKLIFIPLNLFIDGYQLSILDLFSELLLIDIFVSFRFKPILQSFVDLLQIDMLLFLLIYEFVQLILLFYLHHNINNFSLLNLIMKKQSKYILCFTILYWVIAFMGVALFSVAFQKVPLGKYALKANYFSPNIQNEYYIPGLYSKGVGFYYILFPSTKQYLMDNKVTVINRDLETLIVTYSLIYRLNPDKIYTLYEKMGYSYEQRLIGASNSIISSYFLTLNQNQTRIDVQSALVSIFTAAGNKISTLLVDAVLVEALFINQLVFTNKTEMEYQNSLQSLSSYSEQYQNTQLEYRKTLLKIQSLNQSLGLQKTTFYHNKQQIYNDRYALTTSTNQVKQNLNETQMSANYLTRRIFTYYNSTKIVFK